MASSQAFREYLKKLPPRNAIRPEYLMKACRYIYNVWSIISALSAEAGRGAVSRRCLLLEAFFKLILEISSVSERTIVDPQPVGNAEFALHTNWSLQVQLWRRW